MGFGAAIPLRGPKGDQGVAGLGVIFLDSAPTAALQGQPDQLAITTSLDAYIYSNNQWSFVRNLQGPMGLNGVDGSFFSGMNAPDSTVYSGNGQAVYFQASGEVWIYNKTTGWKDSGQSIRGQKGDTGTAGARGSQRFIGNGPPPSDPSTLSNANATGAVAGDEYIDNSDSQNPVLYLFT